jgi:hypothetical protein
MKTPKEKAKELFRKVYFLDSKIWQDTAKQIALIMVDEILSIRKLKDVESQNYWEEVRNEINIL